MSDYFKIALQRSRFVKTVEIPRFQRLSVPRPGNRSLVGCHCLSDHSERRAVLQSINCRVYEALRFWVYRLYRLRHAYGDYRLYCLVLGYLATLDEPLNNLGEYVTGNVLGIFVSSRSLQKNCKYDLTTRKEKMWTTIKVLCALALGSLSAASPDHLAKYRYLLPRNTTENQFDPSSARNLAVYYGIAQNNINPSLYDLCVNSDVDMVMLSFVRQLNGPSALPQFGFTRYCKSPATVTEKTRVSCPDMAANITLCQSMGKKVLISLGGSTSNLTLDSVSEAQEAASILWNVFGAGTGSPSLRPFGNVAVDGFDFGNNPTHPSLKRRRKESA